ncbi:SGNH/GDSL hydrolase family protein [Rhodococcoides yunnanense]|uniref:SGNH/GDSL hydrolase family protein n=1 Tax=Rhodococcoides yunnanense TaxID=278209 RepID=UPI000932CD48|nr:SGNH/GDSL hydrolase family protein [Rhodococcus yunnanensis]
MPDRSAVMTASLVLGAVVVAGAIGAGLYYDSTRTESAAAETVSVYTPPVGLGGPSAVFIGDSYTSGAGASEPVKRWTSLVATDNYWNEENLGIGSTGYVTAAAECGGTPCANYQSVADTAISLHPRIVVVSGGLNDFTAFVDDPAPVVEAIYETLGKLRAGLPDARIITVGPSAAGDVPPFITAYESVVRDASAAVGAQFISLIDPVDVVTEDMIAPDGIHVDDRGHAAIAERVNEELN